MDRETGRLKGFGFVTYSSAEEARAAITEMDGKILEPFTAQYVFAPVVIVELGTIAGGRLPELLLVVACSGRAEVRDVAVMWRPGAGCRRCS